MQNQAQTQSAHAAAVTAEAGADASGSLAQDLASTSAGGQTQLRVAPNKHWLDLQQVRLAQQLNAQGDAAGAIAALQGFLQHQPEAFESSQLLLEIYCQQGRARDAQQLLAQAEFLSPGARQYFAARLALLTQDEPAAIALLEQQLDAAGVNENYRSLLAGLYQKQGSYGKAAASYYSLLKDFGEKPGLLLGYALALDALAQKPGALQAYRRLVEYQDLQTEVRSYAEQRIAALSS